MSVEAAATCSRGDDRAIDINPMIHRPYWINGSFFFSRRPMAFCILGLFKWSPPTMYWWRWRAFRTKLNIHGRLEGQVDSSHAWYIHNCYIFILRIFTMVSVSTPKLYILNPRFQHKPRKQSTLCAASQNFINKINTLPCNTPLIGSQISLTYGCQNARSIQSWVAIQ